MATYKVHWKASTGEARVLPTADATPATFTAIGTFDHTVPGGASDEDDELGPDVNHVFYHHVRDLLYKQGVQDMQRVNVVIPRVTAIASVIADNTLTVAQTSQITNTFTPTNAINKTVTYSSSNTAKATVNGSGLVTGVAAGMATITIMAQDGSVFDTIDITVS